MIKSSRVQCSRRDCPTISPIHFQRSNLARARILLSETKFFVEILPYTLFAPSVPTMAHRLDKPSNYRRNVKGMGLGTAKRLMPMRGPQRLAGFNKLFIFLKWTRRSAHA
jgi:hypothetical protein